MTLAITPLQSSLETETIAILVVAFLAGLGAIYWGFRTYRIGRLIRDTPTETVKSVAIGRTELEGTAVPDEYVFDRPFTDGKCLYASYSIEEYREDPDPDNNNKDWETVLSNTVAAPFYVDDGTGEILVDADSSTTFEISDEYTEEITVNGDPPGAVGEFLSGTGGGPTNAMTDTVSNLLGSVGGFGGRGGGAGPGQSPPGAGESDGTSGQPGPAIAQDEDALEALQSMDESEMKAIQRGQRDPPPELEPYVGEDGDMTQLAGSMGGVFGGGGGMDIAQGRAQQAGGGTQQSDDGPAQQQSTDAATQQAGAGETQGEEQTVTHVPRTDLNSGGAIVDTGGDPSDSDGDDSLLGTLKSTASTVSEFASAGGVSDSHRKRRYEQEVLPVEETTYVYGAAEQRDVDLSASNAERVRITEDDQTGEFIVSDYSESEIASAYTKRSILYILGGLVVSAGALGFLANGLL